MRRSERVTALTGALAVAATLLTVAGVLTVNELTPSPTARAVDHDEPIPHELMWMLIDDCGGLEWRTSDRGLGISQGDDGILRIEYVDMRGIADDREAALATFERVNACLARNPVESSREGSALWRPRAMAERAMFFDIDMRYVAPCLAARGLNPPTPDVADYFEVDRSAWGEIYHHIAYLPDGTSRPFAEVLEARRACGAPSDFLAADGVG